MLVRAEPAESQARLGKQHSERTRPLGAMISFNIDLSNDLVDGDTVFFPHRGIEMTIIVPMLSIAARPTT